MFPDLIIKKLAKVCLQACRFAFSIPSLSNCLLNFVQKILHWHHTGFNVYSKVRTTSHISDKGQVMVGYYGLYSNAHREKMRKTGSDLLCPLIIEDEDPFIPSKGWVEMIKKVYEINPLFCVYYDQ